MDEYLKGNLALWDEWVAINAQSEMYDLAAFKAGNTSLNTIELEELGEVQGKTLLHLQCHFGKDSISWAREGAIVTGIDFSGEAINLARMLSKELGVAATFVQSDIYQLPENLGGQFEIVFTSYGVLNWLPDITAWAKVIAHFLKPDGTFYIVEGHPFLWVFDEQSDDASSLKTGYPYFHRQEPLIEETQGSYANREAEVQQKASYQWNHTLSDILNALIAVGLTLEFVHEFPFGYFPAVENMQSSKDGRWYFNDKNIEVPVMFSLKATKSD